MVGTRETEEKATINIQMGDLNVTGGSTVNIAGGNIIFQPVPTPNRAGALKIAPDVPIPDWLKHQVLGREKEQIQAFNLIEQSLSCVLCGMPGIGKTALAAAIAREQLARTHRPVIWVEVHSAPPEDVMEGIGHSCASDVNLPTASLLEKSGVLFDLLLKTNPSLIVFDDVQKVETLEAVQKAIPEAIPLLVTSRLRMLEARMLVEVGPLPVEEALILFSRATGQEASQVMPEASELCRIFGYHPLALLVAAAMMAEVDYNLPQLYERLKKRPLEVKKGETEVIRQLLAESVDALPAAAQQVFRAFGAFFTTGVSKSLLAAYLQDRPDLDKCLDSLVRRNLVRRSNDKQYLELHDLTYRYAQVCLADPDGNLDYAPTIALTRQYLERHAQAPESIKPDLNHFLETVKIAVPDLQVQMMSFLVLGGYPEPGETNFAIKFGYNLRLLVDLDLAINVARKNPKAYQPTLHFLLSKRGNAAFERGEYPQAVDFYQEALDLAPNLERELVLRSVTAKALAFCKRRKAAHSMFSQAYLLCQELGKKCDYWRSFILEQESHAAGYLKDFKTARRVAASQLALNQKLMAADPCPENQEMLLISLINLGSADLDLAKKQGAGFETALGYHQEAYNLARAQDDALLTAGALTGMAEDYHYLDQHPDAQHNFELALEILRAHNLLAAEQAAIEKMQLFGYIVPAKKGGEYE